MRDEQSFDIACYLPSTLADRADPWLAGPQPSGGYVSPSGLGAFASRSHYGVPEDFTVTDSEQRILLSVWLRDGIEVDARGAHFRIAPRDTMTGFLPGEQWRTRMKGEAHHVGLLLTPALLRHLAGEQGEAFLQELRHADGLQVRAGQTHVLKAAHELDQVLLAGASTPLLREAKSLELLARIVEAGTTPDRAMPGPVECNRLRQARDLLLADLADAPGIEQLARACGMNSFRLKQGFRQLFGLPVHAFHRRARLQHAWDLLRSGRANVSEAGHLVGYANLSHFGAAFRKEFGVLPSEVRS